MGAAMFCRRLAAHKFGDMLSNHSRRHLEHGMSDTGNDQALAMRQSFLHHQIYLMPKWQRVLATDIQYWLFDFCQVMFSKRPPLKRRHVILK